MRILALFIICHNVIPFNQILCALYVSSLFSTTARNRQAQKYPRKRIAISAVRLIPRPHVTKPSSCLCFVRAAGVPLTLFDHASGILGDAKQHDNNLKPHPRHDNVQQKQ